METTAHTATEAAWTVQDSEHLYQIPAWSNGYFAAGASGSIVVRPRATPDLQVDLAEVVRGLAERGLHSPVVIRFSDILVHRLQHLHDVFEDAIRGNGYRGRYVAVYPIKVNQQRPVVEEVLDYGARYQYGLEVGSKPELLAVMALTAGAVERPIICNGFKDERYMEAVVLAARLGRKIIPVIENAAEFRRLMRAAARHDVRPRLGIRIKLASSGSGRWSESSGSGRWSESSGYNSKFGLFATEVLDIVEELREAEMLDCLQLLHCHPGSQVSDIRALKEAVGELAHVYGELVELGAGLRIIDVGGGLGVDYDGSESASASSINYTLEAYANEIVYRIGAICDERGIEHPTIVSESGRAIAAYQSVLVFDVLGASGPSPGDPADLPTSADLEENPEWPQPVRDLVVAFDSVGADTLSEGYHDAIQAREECMHLFGLGYLSLPLRALAERLFWATLVRVYELVLETGHPIEELPALERMLGETYFCNLSIFQSLPDTWAIEQVFPILPIQRLDERPTRRAVLADITCDSDGKLDRFVDPISREPSRLLDVHELRDGEPYYLGAFLVGAYQETLGDLHNLFGDTHVVHIGIDDDGQWSIDEFVEGDTAGDVLGYVQWDVDALFPMLRRDCERAVRENRMTPAESREVLDFYRAGLAESTYLAPDAPVTTPESSRT